MKGELIGALTYLGIICICVVFTVYLLLKEFNYYYVVMLAMAVIMLVGVAFICIDIYINYQRYRRLK